MCFSFQLFPDFFLLEPVLEIEAKAKQDRVNNANSAHLHDKPFNHSGLPKQFIWSGWSVGQVVLVAQVVQVAQVANVVQVVQVVYMV